jgi:hypothetical protein
METVWIRRVLCHLDSVQEKPAQAHRDMVAARETAAAEDMVRSDSENLMAAGAALVGRNRLGGADMRYQAYRMAASKGGKRWRSQARQSSAEVGKKRAKALAAAELATIANSTWA